MPDCLFCKIIAGEIQAYKVYEDDQVLAILDIAPVNPGHILVIPKQHFANFEELPESEINAIFTVVKRLAHVIKIKLDQDSLIMIDGQIVHHFHVHVIPQKPGEDLAKFTNQKYEAGEAEAILNQLKIKS